VLVFIEVLRQSQRYVKLHMRRPWVTRYAGNSETLRKITLKPVPRLWLGGGALTAEIVEGIEDENELIVFCAGVRGDFGNP
jgi:hypothetical protein